MFVYCGNEPIFRKDISGLFWEEIKNFFIGLFGSESSAEVSYTYEDKVFLPDPLPITVKKGNTSSYVVSSRGDSSKPISVYATGNIVNPLESNAGIKVNAFSWSLNISIGLGNTGISISKNSDNNELGVGIKLNLLELKAGIEATNTVHYRNSSQTSYTNISANGGFLLMLYMLLTTGQYQPTLCYN